MATPTQDEIFDKLKRLLPRWFTKDNTDTFNIAHLQAVAAILQKAYEQKDSHVDNTFFTLASEEFLETLGEERGIVRYAGEDLEAYRLRARSFENQTDWILIKSLVDGLVTVGESDVLVDEYNGGMFAARQAFCDRGNIMILYIKNGFSIIIDHQGGEPDAFFEVIRDAARAQLAFGVDFRLVERLA